MKRTLCDTCGGQLLDSCDAGFEFGPITEPAGYDVKGDPIPYRYACRNLVANASGKGRRYETAAAGNDWPIPTRYLPAAFGVSGLQATPTIREMVNIAHKRAIDWQAKLDGSPNSGLQGPSLMVTGGLRTGKTYLASALLNQARRGGYYVVFAPVARIISKLKDAMGYDYQADARDVMSTLAKCDLLLIDDVGKIHPKDWGDDIFWEVFDSRYQDQKPTIITTNFTEQEMGRTRPWDAIVDRIRRDGWLISMNGQN